MSCFAIAANFDTGRRLFTGNINLGQWAPATILPGYFQPGHVDDRSVGRAFLVRERGAAEAIATGLTELGQAMSFGDKRTLFVLELPQEELPADYYTLKARRAAATGST